MSYLGSYIGRPTVGHITLAYLGLHVTFKLQSTVTKPFLTPCTTGPQQASSFSQLLIFILTLLECEVPNLFCQRGKYKGDQLPLYLRPMVKPFYSSNLKIS